MPVSLGLIQRGDPPVVTWADITKAQLQQEGGLQGAGQVRGQFRGLATPTR